MTYYNRIFSFFKGFSTHRLQGKTYSSVSLFTGSTFRTRLAHRNDTIPDAANIFFIIRNHLIVGVDFLIAYAYDTDSWLAEDLKNLHIPHTMIYDPPLPIHQHGQYTEDKPHDKVHRIALLPPQNPYPGNNCIYNHQRNIYAYWDM